MNKILIKIMVNRIRKEWGANCLIVDYNDFPTTPRLNAEGRCGSCQAREVITWLEKWDSML
jgi:hypothetical protein